MEDEYVIVESPEKPTEDKPKESIQQRRRRAIWEANRMTSFERHKLIMSMWEKKSAPKI